MVDSCQLTVYRKNNQCTRKITFGHRGLKISGLKRGRGGGEKMNIERRTSLR